MKISDLVRQIIETAEENIGMTSHINDGFSVGIQVGPFIDETPQWLVFLQRVSRAELEHGEFQNIYACHVSEYESSFYTQRDTLLGALRRLLDKVQLASYWEDGHLASYQEDY